MKRNEDGDFSSTGNGKVGMGTMISPEVGKQGWEQGGNWPPSPSPSPSPSPL